MWCLVICVVGWMLRFWLVCSVVVFVDELLIGVMLIIFFVIVIVMCLCVLMMLNCVLILWIL